VGHHSPPPVSLFPAPRILTFSPPIYVYIEARRRNY